MFLEITFTHISMSTPTRTSKSDLALERVQNLYVLQTKLLSSLDSDLGDPDARRDVREAMRSFEKLLNVVDWRYMGGMDVYDALLKLPAEVTLKLKASPVTSVRRRALKRMAAKKTAKKSVKNMKRAKKAKSTKKTKNIRKAKRK